MGHVWHWCVCWRVLGGALKTVILEKEMSTLTGLFYTIVWLAPLAIYIAITDAMIWFDALIVLMLLAPGFNWLILAGIALMRFA